MMHRYYMSFAQDGFLGAIITEADSEEEAYGSTLYNRINPGGEVAIVQIPDEATNVLTDKTVGLWYLDTIPGKQDWLATLVEVEPESKYEIVYRFRYYEDDRVFDSKDKKSWYKVEAIGTKAYCTAAVRLVAQQLSDSANSGGELIELLNDTGNTEDLCRRVLDQPFAYARMASEEELEKRGMPV